MPIESPYRVVLADDHAMFRRSLKRNLLEHRELEVVGEAGDGLELLTLLSLITSVPHMAIVDLSMPVLGGIEVTSRIKSAYTVMKVLILSVHGEKEYVRGALSAGADGYLLKKDADRELFPAIEKIRLGGIYLSPILPEGEERPTT
jgi:DNA-binding NarL/FixJ family response regulator